MDHVMSDFGNINYKTELEVKVYLLEKENFEIRGQLIDKVLIIKQLKTTYNGKAALTNHHLCNVLEELNIEIVKNRNIGSKHLGSKGLHLNPHGTARLALNLKATTRKL